MLGVWLFIKEYALGKKIGESIKKFKERKLRKVKYDFSDVENILVKEKKNESFQNVLDEVAQIIYSQICQLTKIDSLGLNGLNKGV